MIDWTDPKCMVTQHFSVGDCLMLHHWGRLATKDDGADFDKLLFLCKKLELIRAEIGHPMNVHCMFRSTAYNREIGAPPNDVHSMNLAIDFDCAPGLTTDQVKAILLPILEDWSIRMENNGPKSSWVHIDLHPVIHSRFFLP